MEQFGARVSTRGKVTAVHSGELSSPVLPDLQSTAHDTLELSRKPRPRLRHRWRKREASLHAYGFPADAIFPIYSITKTLTAICVLRLTLDGHIVDVRGHYHHGWCAPRLVASTTEDITRVFDALIAGDLLEADTLRQLLTLVPLLREPDESGMVIAGGMGVFSDRSSRRGRNYHHGGGGPGYDLGRRHLPRHATRPRLDRGVCKQQLRSASERLRSDVDRALARRRLLTAISEPGWMSHAGAQPSSARIFDVFARN